MTRYSLSLPRLQLTTTCDRRHLPRIKQPTILLSHPADLRLAVDWLSSCHGSVHVSHVQWAGWTPFRGKHRASIRFLHLRRSNRRQGECPGRGCLMLCFGAKSATVSENTMLNISGELQLDSKAMRSTQSLSKSTRLRRCRWSCASK